MSCNQPYKIIVLGERMVGKTSLIKRIVGSDFVREYIPTTLTATWQKIIDNRTFNFMEISADPQFSEQRHMYYSEIAGVILVFDITRPETMWNMSAWISEIKPHIDRIVPYIFVGNKIDLIENKINIISYQEILSSISKITDLPTVFKITEASALSNENVDHLLSNFLQEFNMIFIDNVKWSS
ncbi:MAG: GTP-binding protein [Candidatus Kariarchaeaceae archaeon]|jgi:small GTP-binding protein